MKNNTFKKSSIYFDDKPVENSENAITSGAVFSALASASGGLSTQEIYDLIYPNGMRIVCGSQSDMQITLSQFQSIVTAMNVDAFWKSFSVSVRVSTGVGYIYGITRDDDAQID